MATVSEQKSILNKIIRTSLQSACADFLIMKLNSVNYQKRSEKSKLPEKSLLKNSRIIVKKRIKETTLVSVVGSSTDLCINS